MDKNTSKLTNFEDFEIRMDNLEKELELLYSRPTSLVQNNISHLFFPKQISFYISHLG